MRKDRRLLGLVLLLFFGLCCASVYAAETGSIPVGTTLPAFKLDGPTDKADQEVLGLKASEPFTLSQVSGKLVLVEFLSVF
jgi:hypothetical protein